MDGMAVARFFATSSVSDRRAYGLNASPRHRSQGWLCDTLDYNSAGIGGWGRRGVRSGELQTLCNVNHETEVAFLGVIGPRENEEVVGSACYFLSPTTNLAEVAFMVSPEYCKLASRSTR
jgi:hypothetical protein